MATILIVIQAALAMFLGTIALYPIKSLYLRIVSLTFLYIVSLLIAYGQIVLQAQADFKNQYSGDLVSPIQSTSTNPAIVFGGTTLNWGGAANTPQFTFQDGDYIMVNLIDGRAILTTQIRDDNGNEIGDIVNNHWHIYSPQFILDRNFNDNSLEIKNLKGDVTFQVQIYGNEVRIAGFYYKKEGGKPDFIGPWIKDAMFLYPSEEHREELNPNAISPTSGVIFMLNK